MMKTEIKAVIFDMDGTLLNTESVAMRAWMQSCQEFGFEMSQELYFQLIGRPEKATEEVLSREVGQDISVPDLMKNTYRIYFNLLKTESIPVKSGVLKTLDYLQLLELPMAVATSTRSPLAEKKLEQAKLIHYFRNIITGDSVEKGKPAPDIFLKTAIQLKVRPENCLVFEDSEPGLKAALEAGMKVIHIPDIAPVSEQIQSQCLAVLASLNELKESFCFSQGRLR